MKPFPAGIALFLILIFAVSCTKSGALTGGSNGSGSFTTLSGSVNGGLSPVSGATTTLMSVSPGGGSLALGSATTGSDGSYNLSFTNPGGANLLYLTVTGGNSGNGKNSNIQLMTVVGAAASFSASQPVNEITTSAAEFAGLIFNLLQDNNGSITLKAPASQLGVNNFVAQFNNLISNGNLNTANANLTSATQTGLKVMANDFASCIENASNCSKLFADATTSTGTSALTILESGYYALLNSSGNASALYTLAFPLNSITGYNLTSASMPGGFTFNNGLAVAEQKFSLGITPLDAAIDASGNFWVTNFGSSLAKISPQGALIASYSVPGSQSISIAIDPSGNSWIGFSGSGNVVEVNPSGTVIANINKPVNSQTDGLAIDASGNIWLTNTNAGNSVTELNSSGTVLGTFSTGNSPGAIAIDGSGNIWALCNGSVTKLNSSGGLIGNFSGPNFGYYGAAVDTSGNIWGSPAAEFSSSGALLQQPGNGRAQTSADLDGNVWGVDLSNGVYTLNSLGLVQKISSIANSMRGVVIDASGNVWLLDYGGSSMIQLSAAAVGPEFFPYSGPIFP